MIYAALTRVSVPLLALLGIVLVMTGHGLRHPRVDVMLILFSGKRRKGKKSCVKEIRAASWPPQKIRAGKAQHFA
jgi:ABC-type phosphate transport system auxiliary subunit